MLIQCDYQKDDFLVRNQTIYYQGVKVSPVNPTPILSAGTDELYVFPAVFPLDTRCSHLAVLQSRYPVFYECSNVEQEGEMVTLTLSNGTKKRIKPFRDGACDRLLNDIIY